MVNTDIILARRVIIPLVLIILVVILGPILLVFIVYIWVPLTFLAIFGYFWSERQKGKEEALLGVKVLQHPQLGKILHEQNFSPEALKEAALTVGQAIGANYIDLTSEIDWLVLSGTFYADGEETRCIQHTFAGMFAHLPKLEILALDEVGLSNNPNDPMFFRADMFDGLESLEYLDLGFNQLISLVPLDMFTKPPNLKRLFLDRTQVSDDDPAVIAARQRGVVIDLHSAGRTGSFSGAFVSDYVRGLIEDKQRKLVTDESTKRARILQYPGEKYGRFCGNCGTIYTKNFRYKVPKFCEKCGFELVDTLDSDEILNENMIENPLKVSNRDPSIDQQ